MSSLIGPKNVAGGNFRAAMAHHSRPLVHRNTTFLDALLSRNGRGTILLTLVVVVMLMAALGSFGGARQDDFTWDEISGKEWFSANDTEISEEQYHDRWINITDTIIQVQAVDLRSTVANLSLTELVNSTSTDSDVVIEDARLSNLAGALDVEQLDEDSYWVLGGADLLLANSTHHQNGTQTIAVEAESAHLNTGASSLELNSNGTVLLLVDDDGIKTLHAANGSLINTVASGSLPFPADEALFLGDNWLIRNGTHLQVVDNTGTNVSAVVSAHDITTVNFTGNFSTDINDVEFTPTGHVVVAQSVTLNNTTSGRLLFFDENLTYNASASLELAAPALDVEEEVGSGGSSRLFVMFSNGRISPPQAGGNSLDNHETPGMAVVDFDFGATLLVNDYVLIVDDHFVHYSVELEDLGPSREATGLILASVHGDGEEEKSWLRRFFERFTGDTTGDGGAATTVTEDFDFDIIYEHSFYEEDEIAALEELSDGDRLRIPVFVDEDGQYSMAVPEVVGVKGVISEDDALDSLLTITAFWFMGALWIFKDCQTKVGSMGRLGPLKPMGWFFLVLASITPGIAWNADYGGSSGFLAMFFGGFGPAILYFWIRDRNKYAHYLAPHTDEELHFGGWVSAGLIAAYVIPLTLLIALAGDGRPLDLDLDYKYTIVTGVGLVVWFLLNLAITAFVGKRFDRVHMAMYDSPASTT